jgi:hypothetical protein
MAATDPDDETSMRDLQVRIARIGTGLLVGFLLARGFQAHAAVTTTGEVRQPRNIYELMYGIEHTLKNLLTGEELEMFSSLSPEKIKEVRPDLYDRVSQDVKAWTDEWLNHVRSAEEPITSKKLKEAQDLAARIDGILRTHFGERHWPYRTLKVTFLAPKLFLDEHQRSKVTGGMYVPFYPETFFATVDWTMPIGAVLVHESIHFNKTGLPYGSSLTEAITESAARDLVVRYGLQTTAEIQRVPAYLEERKGVEYLLDEMTRRAMLTRQAALEMFLEAYLTGNQEKMAAIFGADAWSRVLELGGSDRTWQTHRIAKALGS